jgi:membrane-bound metal-dependent hydrolase YbcI (DUF457 family)
MLAGHFGLAAAVKSRQPQTPLWSLMLATQLLDVVFLALYLAGVESFRPVEGTSGGYGNFVFSADYSHSLVGSLAISLIAMVVAWVFWGRLNGLVIGVVVFSHWLIDVVVHRGDMAILPPPWANDLPRLGLGLWSIPWLVFAMELVLVLGGAYLYYHASARQAIKVERQRQRDGQPAGGLRQNALVASGVMAVVMLGLLAADFFGIGG